MEQGYFLIALSCIYFLRRNMKCLFVVNIFFAKIKRVSLSKFL